MTGSGCQKCNESHLEKIVNNILGKTCISQQKFSWLGRQSIDSYMSDYNIAIECQGGQHFFKIDIFGGEEGFTKIKQRDITKYNLCKENGIGMIYITNKKFKRYLKQKQFNGIYDKNVLFIEDIEKDNNILFKLINEMKE
jgi:hypothetical protein